MPHYELQLVGGTERIERFYQMSQAPKLGDTIIEDGKTYRRVFSVPTLNREQIAVSCHQYPYESLSLPRNLTGCKAGAFGRPIVRSERHEREIMARLDRKRD